MGGICIKCRSRGQRGPTFHTSPLGGETFYSFSTVFLFKVDQALKTKNTAKLCSLPTVFLVFKVDQAKGMSHSQMLGKFEYGGGPIFKVVLEC